MKKRLVEKTFLNEAEFKQLQNNKYMKIVAIGGNWFDIAISKKGYSYEIFVGDKEEIKEEKIKENKKHHREYLEDINYWYSYKY